MYDDVIRKIIAMFLVVGGALSIFRSIKGREFFMRGLGSKQLGPQISGWLARPLQLLFGVAAWVLAWGLLRQR
jgi:hypothetical protein